MNTPDVSVIMPAYNHERYVGEAIESVLAQTFGNFEFIIVNDGSPDQTERVIKQYNNPRIRYYFQDNQGAHHALNRGIGLSRGEYISIVNSDDLYHRERLKTLLETATRTGARFLITGIELIDKHSRSINDPAHPAVIWYERAKSFYLLNESPAKTLFGANYAVSTSNFFFHSSLIKEIGLFRPYKYAHDYDFLFRVVRQQPGEFKFLYQDKLLCYRLHGRNTILNRREALDEVFGLIISTLKEVYGPDIDIPLDRLNEIMKNKERLFTVKGHLEKALLNSWSWRITAPLRHLHKLLKGHS
jgi:glycosyltransferase involved in cell wall biosynthesis